MYWDIEAKTDKLTGGLKTSKAEVKSFGDQTKTSMLETYAKVQLAQQAFDAIYGSMKKVYAFAREGADLEYLSSKFDNLTESIGTTTDALMKDLRKATDGTVSDMELMASATDFMALGLANSHDEVVRLTSVAGQLGMNMNQLVLTLTNQTTMRFDALGVSVDGFDEKVAALKKTGMSANDAFNEAFLQQAEEQIKTVGSVTDESIGSFMRFESSIGNLAAKMQTVATPATEDLISVLTDGINVMSGSGGWSSILDDVNDSLGKSIPTYDDYRNAVNNVLEDTGLLVDENGKLIATNIDGAIKLGAARKAVELLSEAEYDAAVATQKWDDHEKKLADQFGINIPLLGDMEDSTVELKDATNDADAAMRDYTEALLFKIAAEGLSSEQALLLADAMGLVDDRTVMATEKTKLYKDWLDQGAITIEEYNDLILKLGDYLGALPENIDINVHAKFINDIPSWVLENSDITAGGGGGGNNPETKAGGGGVMAGEQVKWGEYGRPEMFITPSSGQVVNAQQIVEAMRSSGVNMAGGVTIDNINVYPSSGADAVQYSIERAKGYAQL